MTRISQWERAAEPIFSIVKKKTFIDKSVSFLKVHPSAHLHSITWNGSPDSSTRTKFSFNIGYDEFSSLYVHNRELKLVVCVIKALMRRKSAITFSIVILTRPNSTLPPPDWLTYISITWDKTSWKTVCSVNISGFIYYSLIQANHEVQNCA